MAVTTPSGGNSSKVYPFLFGTQEQRVPIAAINITPGLKAATVRLPKNGYIAKMIYRLVTTTTVSVGGAAGTPKMYNLISSIILAYNGGFQYRQVDGESLYVMNVMRYFGQGDPVMGGPSIQNYNPASASAQPTYMVWEDEIALNTQYNADKYLLAAQARNADITLDVFFGTVASVVAGNETVSTITGTLYVDGLYFLDPNYTQFAMPDLGKVQQFVVDTSYTNVVVGDNTVSIVPVNGPKYLQVAFKVQTNNTPDPGGAASVVTRLQLKVNNGVARIDTALQVIQQENMRQLGRQTLGYGQGSPLPAGWYLLDFLNDVGLNNAVSQLGIPLTGAPAIGRNVLSTEKIANLWLIVTIATGTTVTNSIIKLVKRAEMPAVA